ncbi:MAG: hypothetical protein M3O46_14585, partial [Myxococcota bacterium]|nr:hypothetical protein [Myxococcota bacterium]
AAPVQRTEDAEDPSAEPHARAAGNRGTMPGLFEPPDDREEADTTVPPGTIVVDLRNADDAPVTDETVTLGMLINSIAKGDSRKHVQAVTDERGRVVFSGLETVSNIAYRVSSGFQGGSFGASPFQLEQAKAMHVVLHVYPVTHDLQQALIVSEVTVAAEVRDDRIQMEEVLKFYNLGRTAWQPQGVRMSLPDGFKAFNTQTSMSDQGADEADGAAVLHGTFPPGRHTVEFRWQLPWSGDTDFEFGVGLPPHVAIARALMPAAPNLKLTVSGFPPADLRHDAQGQRFLVVERQLRPEDPKLTELTIGIHGLPAAGPGRVIATLLAACAVVVGLVLSFYRRSSAAAADSATTRSLLLEEISQLESAHRAGEVGPKTYERTRKELVDALARTLAPTPSTV